MDNRARSYAKRDPTRFQATRSVRESLELSPNGTPLEQIENVLEDLAAGSSCVVPWVLSIGVVIPIVYARRYEEKPVRRRITLNSRGTNEPEDGP